MNIFYKLGKIVLILGLIALPLYYLGFFAVLEPYNYCVFKRVVGLYCPGCGGTHAVKELLSGHLLKSLYYHPAVLYFVVFYVVFMLRMFLQKYGNAQIFGHLPIKSVQVSEKRVERCIFIGIGIIFLQWAVKNAALLVFHYYWF